MSRHRVRDRLVALAIAVAGGIVVKFLFHDLLLATFVLTSGVVISSFVLARNFPIIIARDHRQAELLTELLGYIRCYRDQSCAEPDLIAAANETQRLDIMLIRGHTFVLADGAILDRMISSPNTRARILLLHPSSDAMKKYLRERRFNKTEKKQYLEKCEAVTHKLNTLKGTRSLEYGHYDCYPSWKLIITDAKLFVAPYDAKSAGSRLSYASYHDMGKPYFIGFSNYFQVMWDRQRNSRNRRGRRQDVESGQ